MTLANFSIRTVFHTLVFLGFLKTIFIAVESVRQNPTLTNGEVFWTTLVLILVFSSSLLVVLGRLLATLIAYLIAVGVIPFKEKAGLNE